MGDLAKYQWITDLILPSLAIIIMCWLYLARKCDLAIFLAFWAGCLIGAIWEFTFDLLGDSFTVHEGCHFVANNEVCLTENPLPRWYISLAHTIEDGGIFMIGVGLAWLILGRNKREHFTRWHWGEFGIIWAWGVISNYLVDWTSIGKTFLFIPSEYNPAYYETSLFSANGETLPYTVVPDAIWYVATIPFYLVLLWLKRRYGGNYRGGDAVNGFARASTPSAG